MWKIYFPFGSKGKLLNDLNVWPPQGWLTYPQAFHHLVVSSTVQWGMALTRFREISCPMRNKDC